jgi:hypothetical protein
MPMEYETEVLAIQSWCAVVNFSLSCHYEILGKFLKHCRRCTCICTARHTEGIGRPVVYKDTEQKNAINKLHLVLSEGKETNQIWIQSTIN